MKPRDIAGILIIGVLAYILISKVTTGSPFSNPFGKYFYIKVGLKVDCPSVGPIYTYCHIDPSYLTVEGTNSKSFSIEPFSLVTHESKISIEVTVTSPSGRKIVKSAQYSVSKSGYKYYYFKIPADEKGRYSFVVKVCGNYYGFTSCKTGSGVYTVS